MNESLRDISAIDRMLEALQSALNVVAGAHHAARPDPGDEARREACELDESDRRHAAALMRVNHVGEVCAQALYEAQSLLTRSPALREVFERAAGEESDHLAWTRGRVEELGDRVSLLVPLWYAGSFAIGCGAALLGDRASLGFMSETERQVEGHLDEHLGRLPASDARSRAILETMRAEEIAHGAAATAAGARSLPAPLPALMRHAARVMTRTSYWL